MTMPAYPPLLLVAAAIGAAVVAWLAMNRSKLSGRRVFAVATSVMCVAIIFMGMRFMRPKNSAKVLTRNLDVLFAVDTTLSMWADDYHGKERMEGVKEVCAMVMEELDGASFALVRYDNTSRILSPYSRDTRNINDALSVIDMPLQYYAKGSSMAVASDAIEDMLKRSQEERVRIVFLLSDGENTTEDAASVSDSLKQYIQGGAVLGFGTSKGGEMVYEDGSAVYDPDTGDKALSKIDEEELKNCADIMGIPYVHVENVNDVDEVVAQVLQAGRLRLGDERADAWDDLYQYGAVVVLVAILADAFIVLRRHA